MRSFTQFKPLIGVEDGLKALVLRDAREKGRNAPDTGLARQLIYSAHFLKKFKMRDEEKIVCC